VAIASVSLLSPLSPDFSCVTLQQIRFHQTTTKLVLSTDVSVPMLCVLRRRIGTLGPDASSCLGTHKDPNKPNGVVVVVQKFNPQAIRKQSGHVHFG